MGPALNSDAIYIHLYCIIFRLILPSTKSFAHFLHSSDSSIFASRSNWIGLMSLGAWNCHSDDDGSEEQKQYPCGPLRQEG